MIRNDIAIFYSNVFLGFKVYCNQVVLKEKRRVGDRWVRKIHIVANSVSTSASPLD